MAVAAAAVLVRLFLGASVFGSTSDVLALTHAAEGVRQGVNVYAAGIPFNYSPLVLWLLGGLRGAADLLGYAFPFVLRWPLALADGAVVLGLERALRREHPEQALRAALFYAFNPIGLAVVLHGQLDGLVVLGLFGAWLALAHPAGGRGRAALAGAALAWGAGVKVYALLLLPKLALDAWRTRRLAAFGFGFGALFLGVLSAWPHPAAAWAAVFGYRGGAAGNWGLSLLAGIPAAVESLWRLLGTTPAWLHTAVWLGWWQLPLGPLAWPLWLLLLAVSGVYVWIVPGLASPRAWVLLCLTVYTFAQNLALQYLVWPLAFAAAAAALDPGFAAWLRGFVLWGGAVYFFGLLADRNLLAPLLGFSLDLPWRVGRLLLQLLCLPLWGWCAWGWWQQVRTARTAGAKASQV